MNQRFTRQRMSLHPTQVLVLGFFAVIVLGALLLTMPFATVDQRGLAWLDAVFMATSAVCVTGLAVVDPGTQLSRVGQVIILVLVQIGGLGFMTLAAMVALLLGKRITINERVILKESLNQMSLQGIVRVVRYIVLLTISIELVGAIILAWSFRQQMPMSDALFNGLFHAVSAFNNAGFDLFTTSMVGFNTHPLVMMTIIVLLTVGGMGLLVWVNALGHGWHVQRWSLHTKIVVITTATLLVTGSVLVFVFEYNGSAFADFTVSQKILNSLFQSATSRTAGFFSVTMTTLTSATIVLMMMLMFIGASPGSTGGGIKTTTFAMAILTVYNVLRGRSEIHVWQRTVTAPLLLKSFAVIFVSLSWVMVMTLVLSVTESAPFLWVAFEVVSAFATVGLTLGLTPALSDFGKWMIIATMFVGRVGPLTLFLALMLRSKEPLYRYPEESVLIG
ncbi:MAG: Trk family potassium uptake protein [Chloroflexi bacterium]|nr:Trk family potassium uptake protein [Chloroflexota bacterium]